MKFAVMFFLAFFSAVPAYADGDVYVVDGDSLKLGEQNVRLAHIDAPEYYQTCKRADKSTYNCGIKAREKLESLLKLGELSCKTVGRDIYNRDMSECFAGRTNINLEWYAAAGLWCIKAGTPPIWRRRPMQNAPNSEYGRANI